MTVETTVQPIDEVFSFAFEDSTPKQQSETFSTFADEVIEEAALSLAEIFGQHIDYLLKINQQPATSTHGVPPNGVIDVFFDLVGDVLRWIAEQLDKHSPVGGSKDPHPGLYRKSHVLFADGVITDVDTPFLDSAEFVFINTVPYARKIEHGSSSQAPDGVYQAVATLAQQRFGGIAKISFAYRPIADGSLVEGKHKREDRNPAIIVEPYKA